MQNVIRIKNAIFYGYHGVKKEEQKVGGKYEADIDMYCDFSKAAISDNLSETIDYQQIYLFVSELIQERKFFLIETLAMTIADEILKNFDCIEKIAVRIRKKNAPVGGLVDCVEAEVIKEKSEIKKTK